jgi:hypothetical protein
MYMALTNVRKTEMHIGEPLLPETSVSRLKKLLNSWENINHGVLIRFWQN